MAGVFLCLCMLVQLCVCVQFVFGIIFVLLAVFLWISLLLTTIDKAMNSICSSCFLIGVPQIVNPLNEALVFFSRVRAAPHPHAPSQRKRVRERLTEYDRE
jgi:hypothetical protein